jgi:cytochrome P450
MIRHPNAWTRVRAEIDAAQQEGLCQDAVISYADAQKLSFLQACIKEALRIFHPVTMGTQRVVPKEGIVIGGKPFPAGTTLSLNTFSMNLSTDVWGPDARVFNPDRWIEGDTLEMTKKFLPVSPLYHQLYNTNPTTYIVSNLCSSLAASEFASVKTWPKSNFPRSFRR